MDKLKEALLKEIMSKRGYVLDFHKILIDEDPEFLKSYEELISTAYTNERTLDKKVKEFILISALTAVRASKHQIGTHIKLALEYGATKKEVLEVLECLLPPCGVPSFMNALNAYKDITQG